MRAPSPFFPGTAGREDEVALCGDSGARTWAQLETRIRRIANGFATLGLGEGDRVALLAANGIEWVEVMLASIRGGTKVVPVNWHLTAAETAYILADSGARMLVCDAANAAVGHAAAAAAGVAHVRVIGEDFDAWCEAEGDAEPANRQAGGPMFYTSGTTGRPKGVINRARETTVDRIWTLLQASAHQSYRYQDDGVHLLACPVYHAAPYMHVMLSVATGHRLVVMTRFAAENFLQRVHTHGVTTSHVVPTQLARLLALPDEVKARYDTASIHQLIHGAAPCAPWVKQAMIDWLGPVISEYYAFSEGAGLTFATSADWLARPGTVGRAPDGVQMKVVDEAGADAPAGDIGTIYFRRPGQPSPEYHNAPEKTAASALPREASGKLMKRKLREPYWEGRSRRI